MDEQLNRDLTCPAVVAVHQDLQRPLGDELRDRIACCRLRCDSLTWIDCHLLMQQRVSLDFAKEIDCQVMRHSPQPMTKLSLLAIVHRKVGEKLHKDPLSVVQRVLVGQPRLSAPLVNERAVDLVDLLLGDDATLTRLVEQVG